MAESCGVCVLIAMEYVCHFSLDFPSNLFAETASFLQAVHAFRSLLYLRWCLSLFFLPGHGRREKGEERRQKELGLQLV